MTADPNLTTPSLDPAAIMQAEARRPQRTGIQAFMRDLRGFVTDWRACIRTATPIGPTHPDRAYITAKFALNLQTDEPGGDWHPACWHLGRDGPPATSNPATTPIIGYEGLHDVRRHLRKLRHPAGLRPVPVWGAAYWRAIVDWAALVVQAIATERRPITIWQGDSPRYEDLWLIGSDQHGRILEACRRIAARQPAARQVWDLWFEMIAEEERLCNAKPPC